MRVGGDSLWWRILILCNGFMIGGQRMGKPLGMDLRHRVIASIEGGLSTRAAAARFSIGIATAGAWARLKRKTGEVRPARQGPPPGSKLDPHEAFILGLIERTPDIALAEIAGQLQADRGVRAVPATIWYFLDKRGLTFKKNRSRQRAGAGRHPRGKGAVV
jgi:transposase